MGYGRVHTPDSITPLQPVSGATMWFPAIDNKEVYQESITGYQFKINLFKFSFIKMLPKTEYIVNKSSKRK